MIKYTDISTYLGYAVSAVTFVFGIMLISGQMFEYIPSNFRITFGIVMMLWGIYRFVYTKSRKRQQERGEEDE